jgi:hypothetical protein
VDQKCYFSGPIISPPSSLSLLADTKSGVDQSLSFSG